MTPMIGNHRSFTYQGADSKTFGSKIICCLAALIVSAWATVALPHATAGGPPGRDANYSRLVDFIRQEDRVEPIFAFNEFEDTIDKSIARETLQYFNERRDLIRKIRKDLGGGSVRWKLENFRQRLVFVPETRAEYADLHKNYCVDVIDLIVDEIGIDNPYSQIITLQQTDSVVFDDTGVTAFLVHNLAREYRGTYSFFRENPRKELAFALKGTYFIGEIGSYASQLTIKDDGAPEFVHHNYTIWQNSARLPYNALIVPIEETLHITLRPYTEQAILNELQNPAAATPLDVEEIVDHWVAVEEALVGGLVDVLFSKVVSKFFDEFSADEISRGLDSKLGLEKYRHLPAGIRVVKEAGYRQVVDTYTRNPHKINEMLRKFESQSLTSIELSRKFSDDSRDSNANTSRETLPVY